jgi:hypothetical protein
MENISQTTYWRPISQINQINITLPGEQTRSRRASNGGGREQPPLFEEDQYRTTGTP